HTVQYTLDRENGERRDGAASAVAGKDPLVATLENRAKGIGKAARDDHSALMLEDAKSVEEIFDYRPSTRMALEVVMSWRGTILDVEHFVDHDVTIGTQASCDFAIPGLLNSERFPFVTRQGEEWIVTLDPKMKGVLHGGKVESLETLRSNGNPTADGVQIAFRREQFAKISLGEIDFYLCYSVAPPRLKRRRLMERDPFFFRIFFTSLLVTTFVTVGLLAIRIPENIEAEKVPDRIATILYRPEQFRAKPTRIDEAEASHRKEFLERVKEQAKQKRVKLDIKPNPDAAKKPVPKEMNVSPQSGGDRSKAPKTAQGPQKGQSEAKEGEGARAKGAEGTRGKPNAPADASHQTKAKRPSPQGGMGRGSGNSQVADEGNVDLLKGASEKILNLLGNSAAQLGKGGQKIAGFGGFDTQGSGGLALSGEGSGGGGDAASLGGLSDKGKGGGRVGTGMGASGTGTGIVGGKYRVNLRSGGPEEAVVMGAIDKDAVEAALLAHKDEFLLCYEREINAENPDLAGRVVPNFVIGSSGRVTEAGIAETTLKNVNTERCVLGVIKRIQFPIPRGGGIVQVTYPFKFRPLGK
ncbi:MAG: AgmX/PglI C-terminal domain-containing protein, partial [Bdellovibrionota bacterium]